MFSIRLELPLIQLSVLTAHVQVGAFYSISSASSSER